MRQLPETEGEPVELLGRPRPPALCPDFLIETYLDHQVKLFLLKSKKP